MRTLLILLAFLAVADGAAAKDCVGVQSPLCTLDHSAVATIACPAGAVSARITDGATFTANVSVSGTGPVSFAPFVSETPLQRTVTATCTDSFGVAGSPTRYVGLFRPTGPLGAPTVSGQ